MDTRVQNVGHHSMNVGVLVQVVGCYSMAIGDAQRSSRFSVKPSQRADNAERLIRWEPTPES